MIHQRKMFIRLNDNLPNTLLKLYHTILKNAKTTYIKQHRRDG